MSDLEPCPWCGDSVLEVREGVINGNQWVACTGCGASGVEAHDEASAIAAWNRRAPSAEETRLRAEVASLRATLGQQPAAEGAEPIGCPLPGACGAVRAHAAAYAAGAAEMRERAAELCDVPQWLKDVIPHVPATPAERAEYETRTNTARAIKAAIRALPLPAGGSGWRPIETAPRDGESILCYAPETRDRAAVRRSDYWWIEKGAFANMRPSQPYTHWQPLPAAPEEGG